MSEENKKEAPAKDVEETKPAAQDTKAETASNANLVKNLIFAVFIILAIFYCFNKLSKRNVINEANRAIAMYNDAVNDKRTEDDGPNYVTLREAINVFEGLFGENDNNTISEKIDDENMINEINATWSKCYSLLAMDPSLSAEESDALFLKAYGKDDTNPDIPLQIRNMPQLNIAPVGIEGAGPNPNASSSEETPDVETTAPDPDAETAAE
ncbi:MAG: hypothetical protein II943_03215 [Victivallales bacterium]|nr:hypothetical protein [Victivallales bacterium]